MTTYETLRNEINIFNQNKWTVVIYDECQKINNPKARMTDMAKSVYTDLFILLTGTPVENGLSELWCLSDCAWPGLLGDLKVLIINMEIHRRR